MASPPVVCKLRSVAAVAVPEGKGSLSILINWRFKGMAMQTPSRAIAVTQIIICHQIMGCPVVR